MQDLGTGVNDVAIAAAVRLGGGRLTDGLLRASNPGRANLASCFPWLAGCLVETVYDDYVSWPKGIATPPDGVNLAERRGNRHEPAPQLSGRAGDS